jgi:inosine/xanthosine triphosphate pyrophosphatase family protein
VLADPQRPGRTMAELEPGEKAAISHRAQAVAALRARLAERA